MLVSLLFIYVRLDIGKSEAKRIEKVAVHIPFSVYLGWITVATIANVTAVLVVLGVESYGVLAEILTILVIAVAVIITYAMLIIRKDIPYALVVLWASLGIFLKQLELNLTIAITALTAVALILAGIVLIIVLKLRK